MIKVELSTSQHVYIKSAFYDGNADHDRSNMRHSQPAIFKSSTCSRLSRVIVTFGKAAAGLLAALPSESYTDMLQPPLSIALQT